MPNAEPTSPRPMPSLRGELVYLRPAERSDLDLFVRWFADAETTRYLGVRAPFSRAMEDKWFEEMLAEQGTAFILVEQHAEMALGLTENAVVIERGEVVHRAPSAQLAKDDVTLERLIGLKVA